MESKQQVQNPHGKQYDTKNVSCCKGVLLRNNEID